MFSILGPISTQYQNDTHIINRSASAFSWAIIDVIGNGKVEIDSKTSCDC